MIVYIIFMMLFAKNIGAMYQMPTLALQATDGTLLLYNHAARRYERSAYPYIPPRQAAHVDYSLYNGLTVHSENIINFLENRDFSFQFEEHAFHTWVLQSLDTILTVPDDAIKCNAFKTLLTVFEPASDNVFVNKIYESDRARAAQILASIGFLLSSCAYKIGSSTLSLRCYYKSFLEIGTYYLGCALGSSKYLSQSVQNNAYAMISGNKNMLEKVLICGIESDESSEGESTCSEEFFEGKIPIIQPKPVKMNERIRLIKFLNP